MIGTIRLGALHTRYLLVETFRVPMAVIGAFAFPALSFLFFVVPQRAVAEVPLLATQAVIQLCVFAVMANALFGYGLSIAQARETPWEPYLRTLPAPAASRIIGQVFSTGTIGLLAIVPVVLLGAFLTEAEADAGSIVRGLVALALTSLPFVFAGISIGYALPAKAAIAVVQVVMFTLAFAGGLFLPPQLFPDWLDTLSRALPSRQARELVVWAVQGGELPGWELLGAVAWALVLLVLALVLFRRDEGRRFR
ncbi:ABC transporter permease [Protaetiibacter larvae]|uniref:ABC transporter permease n=1 Tax=Protaetiibacter larvae TaxID=2592654 RepID=A0A5C1Y6D9_9MICO|nr:ABC transporter permease [Protaetiibacter larvae]QEO09464.1 ABC transporter permease [Protaetiibacter larvae]